MYRGANHPTFKGRVRTSNGYVRVFLPEHPLATADGYVLEHRLVLHEAEIAIPPKHHVHHVNGNKADNRRENLAVLSPAEHLRLHVEAPR